jgi:tetratricopeptide (TPR) repeat protein
VPTALEAEISSLLQEEKDLETAARPLIERWQRSLLSAEEQVDVAQFLVTAGLFTTLFAEIRRLIGMHAKLPWGQFAEALGRAGVKPDENEVMALFDGAESQGLTQELLRSRQLDLVNRAFSEKRKEFAETEERDLEDRKQSLKDKIHYLRANRMFEQEAGLLDEFQALFPEETEIKIEREALNLRWAREVISNSSAASDPVAGLQWRSEQLPADQQQAKSLIVRSAREFILKDPRLAYDLAISLHLMDFNIEALECLENAPATRATDWLRLELMVRARHFISVLDEAEQLELAYADDPDATFAATYARARALYGLGHRDTAIELLRSVVRIRPHYKSAQSLLMDWDGGER